ncbi:MAG: methionine--tRNA ligase [Patescibacteria group bacterium]|nr:methionine--tRNA ligase [Patescibacteria group bacterium]
MEKNKFYITTAIDYTNGKPHIGHVFEKVLTDVIARYHREKGDDVFFLTGSDEHGTKMELLAKEKGVAPKVLVDENVKAFMAMKEKYNLSYDRFIRTTDEDHIQASQELWRRCKAKGDIYLKKYQGLYCAGCESFKKESDLVDGKCLEHDCKPEVVEEENWFFKLSNYKNQIKDLIEKDEIKIIPEHRKKEVLNVLEEIEDFSISRPKEKVGWGIEVPDDPTHNMYVWFDALTNYISGLGWPNDMEKFNAFWPTVTHVIGKDITRFHAIYWPAMLLSGGVQPPKNILIHGFVTSGGKKMSKSTGNVVDPEEALSRYGADALRYFLIREIPTTEDGDFTFEKFDARYESDLANSLGNLVSRVTNIVEKNNIEFQNQDLRIDIKNESEEYRFDKVLEKIWEKVHEANKYVDDEKPWAIKDNPEKLNEVMNNLLNSIKSIGEALKPFMPETSEKILKIFESEKIVKAEPLFPKKLNT